MSILLHILPKKCYNEIRQFAHRCYCGRQWIIITVESIGYNI
jgi:hypothetical protein